ncbi:MULTISPECIES: sulfotransferase family protein [unclassified Sphingomonas]|uniref:sulfotransferase family protein n=1 Tax=unclassified Sphingomonas TaxID=196159 RepID=UPI00070109EB|nr:MULTISPECIES: sulfotransferase [unclassified Sphingomonas]KQS51706.1 sulfotransferase [Sphingomonas sp. Leaf198]
MRSLHFISGLPRSGSTLLAAILKQNPRVNAAMSSPVAGMFGAMQTVLSGKNEFSVFITERKRKAILRGLFDSFYGDDDKEVVFDTNRAWSGKLAALSQLYPDAKMVCCVRSMVSIIDSFERLVQANPLEPSRMFQYQASGSVYSRVDEMLRPEGVIGSALQGLKQACYSPLADRLLIVPYEKLVGDPEAVLDRIYGFIGEQRFAHNFSDVAYDADEFDVKMGLPNLHRVGRVVEAKVRTPALPPDLISRFGDRPFWAEPAIAARHVA